MNLKENIEYKNKEMEKIALKNKKLKSKLNKYKRQSYEVVKKINEILLKINPDKMSNFEELKINKEQELKYEQGMFIGNLAYGRREGKGIMYYNVGDRYDGEWINNKREGKGIMHFNSGDRYEGKWISDKMEGKG